MDLDVGRVHLVHKTDNCGFLSTKLTKKMRAILIITLLSLWGNICLGQIKLQMDKFGKRKTLDYEIGDEIIVKIKGEDGFHRLKINDLHAEAGIIVTQFGAVNVEDITHVRTERYRKLGLVLRYKLWVFGTAWGSYSLIAALLAGYTLTWGTLIVVGVAFFLGWLVGRLLRRRTYRLNRRRKRRLRIRDIRFTRPGA